MDIQSIFNAGGTIIKNPNYSKGKKNTQPEYITVSDLDSGVAPDGSLVAGIAYNAAAQGNQDILGRNGELDKYINHGLTPNGWENLDLQLAEQQSNWTKAGNALVQTLVSELAIGTIKGFSDLADLLGQAVGLSDGDYSNLISQFLEEKQEEFRNFAPIYTDPSLNISNGGLNNLGWCASNIPSIISSLTLLLPSSGITKGLSYLGKTANIGARTRNAIRAVTGVNKKLKTAEEMRLAGKSAEEIANATKLSKTQKFLTSSSTANQASLFLENATTAALSRAIENYQEARQTYNDMYVEASEYLENDKNYENFLNTHGEELRQKGVDINNKDEIAKYVSTSAADRTFQTDWFNVCWDVLQMYGLRNAWKGLKNADGTPAAVRRADINARKYFGKKPEEIAKLKAKRTFKTKAKEWAEDRLYDSKLIIGAQLSEGAEEALNYIATEEGMNFGGLLLGKNKREDYGVWGNVLSDFDGRLTDYLQAPELWDSVFWGVLGGVVFEIGGSYVQRVSQKFNKSKADKEAVKQLPWYKLDQLPENERRISEIEARSTDFAVYKSKLDQINNGIDIYNSTESNEVKFANEELAQIARDKLKDEFIASMTLRAMNSGNYDMLKAFLQDENIRKALIESGAFGHPSKSKKTSQEINQEATEYINSAIKRMDEIADMYEQELTAIDYASSRVKIDMLAEYMQIMANNNVNTMLAIRQNDLSLGGINARIAQLENQFRDNLDPNLNYNNTIRVNLISSELGKLYADRAEVEKQPNSLSKTIAIKNINKRIEVFENELSDSELVFATLGALRFTKEGKDKYSQSSTEQYVKYLDRAIINHSEENAGKLLDEKEFSNLSRRARTILSAEAKQQYDVFNQDEKGIIDSLKRVSGELNEMYAVKAATELSTKMLHSDIIRTSEQVNEYANMLHNTMSEARKKAIEKSNKVIYELYEKYGEDVKQYINGVRLDDVVNRFNESERKNLDKALKVLDLTKSYNESLAAELDAMFDLYDNIKASRDSAESQENDTNLDSDTASNEAGLNNSSSSTGETNTVNQNGQNGNSQTQIDPQNISNRTPSYYAKFWFPKGVLTSSRHSSTDNGGAAVYDNGDGTFTLDVRNDKKALNDDRFFSNAKEVDLTRPYEVVDKPILKKNKKGKLEVYKQGTLVNTDTLEYQQSQQATEQIEQSEQAETPVTEQSTEQVAEQTPISSVEESPDLSTEEKISEDNAEDNTPVEDSTDTNPSTGEGDKSNSDKKDEGVINKQNPNSSNEASVYDDVIPYQTTTEDEIRMASLNEFQQKYKANKDVDLDALAKDIINEKINEGVNRQVAEAAVNKSLNIIKRVIERTKNRTAKTMQSSIDEVIVQSSIIDINKNNPFITDYKNAVREMLNAICKEFGINEYNGRKYITLEDVLRYVNLITNDSQTSNMMIDALKVYLSTDEAKKEFITTDEDIKSDTLKKNIAKSAMQRYQERVSDTTTQRVDIWTLRQGMSNNKELKLFEEAINELKKGDKLTYAKEGNRLVLKDPKGRTVGSLAIPGINPEDGSYQIDNDGWRYNISSQSDGTVKGNIKTLFSRWLNEVNDASKELNGIIYELAFAKPSPERKKELLKQFAENKEIVAAKNQGFVSKNASNEKLINGLVKLWRFKSYSTGDVTTLKNRAIAKSLDLWFKKLINSYDGVNYLLNANDGTIEVSNISDGEIIRAAEQSSRETSIPANKAIAGGVKHSIHKIAVSNTNVLRVSGMSDISFSGVKNMNTFVLLPNRNGSYEYVQAYPADVIDDYIGKDAKEIIETIKDKAFELLETHAKNPTPESFDAFKNFIKSVLLNSHGNSSLFWNLSLFENGNRFGIALGKTTKFSISSTSTFATLANSEFNPNEQGYRQKDKSIQSKEAKEFLDTLINNLRFNINPTYILSDNATKTILNGIATRSNGKFEIKVGDKTWAYESFNDFVLSNNLVKLNTKPNADGTSNFNSRATRNQAANQILEIKITSIPSSPVEENQQTDTAEPSTTPTRDITIPEKALAILNGTQKSNHIGNDIAALVFTEKQLKSLKSLKLLPENVIFDKEFNNRKGYKVVNAEYNPQTDKITVGKKWLDMFNNPNDRRQAIRKLIHEQLHYKLKRKKGYVRSVQSIYDEFKKYLDDNNVPKDAHIRAYLFEGETNQLNALEEFLIESLTSEELAKYLNSIKTEVPTKRGAKNLFQKIMQVLSDIFGWKITKGSLYEKELNTIRELNLDNNSIENSTKTKSETTQSETTKTNNEQSVSEQTPIEKVEPKVEPIIEVKTEEDNSTNDDYVDISNNLMDMFSTVTEVQDSTYSPEMITIKQKAIDDGTFMKAPNGNPTNLNERQWLQVRTKNFINWFGNWINNPTEASKVIDENGEPLVVYHGSPNKWNIYNPSKDGTNTDEGYYGKGLYASSVESKAEQYGQIYKFFVNIKRPLRTGTDPNINVRIAIENVQIAENFNRDGDLSKYDGVLYSGSEGLYEEIVIPTPNQIKSATSNNGDFSTTNDDIRFSSVTEQDADSRVNLMSGAPSITSVVESLPLTEQAAFASLVASAEIETSCR